LGGIVVDQSYIGCDETEGVPVERTESFKVEILGIKAGVSQTAVQVRSDVGRGESPGWLLEGGKP
jgi:hypothetical protein